MVTNETSRLGRATDTHSVYVFTCCFILKSQEHKSGYFGNANIFLMCPSGESPW